MYDAQPRITDCGAQILHELFIEFNDDEHGIRAAEDPELLELIVSRGIALEVCPVSNVALGVYSDLSSVPLPELMAAGATIALGADDPLLFGSRLLGQYAAMRAAHELDDAQLAELARMSVRASSAPSDVRTRLLDGIDGWLGSDDDG